MKKYGGSRLLDSLRPDLHNHHGHVGKERIRLKRLFLSPIAKPRQEAGAALRILLMDRTFHLQTDAQAEGQGLGGGKEIGGKLEMDNFLPFQRFGNRSCSLLTSV